MAWINLILAQKNVEDLATNAPIRFQESVALTKGSGLKISGTNCYQKPGKKIYQESERTKVHVTMYPSSKQYFTNPAQISFYLAPNQ